MAFESFRLRHSTAFRELAAWPLDGGKRRALVLFACVAALGCPPAAAADYEEFTVTARKRDAGEGLQDVPLAVSAFSAEELEARFSNDLTDLSARAPNVSLTDVGTSRGIANFTIRGLGINSTIPSIDPTVGVFVDGVYMGITAGIINDFFDLEGIEILRGPQGLLFGRNVTGGAVLLRTRKPTEEFEMSFRGDFQQGTEEAGGLAVSGPILPGELLGRLAIYHKDDEGWHTNLADLEDDFGAYRITLVRPSLTYYPGEDSELTVRYERGQARGDGPRGQNRGLYDRTSWDFAVDEKGYADSDWSQLFAEFNMDVPLGNGTITNILGWRRVNLNSRSDVDASPLDAFHGDGYFDQEQFSNEFRYFGSFFDDRVDVTAGAYWFDQDIGYWERRELFKHRRTDPAPVRSDYPAGPVGDAYYQAVLGAYNAYNPAAVLCSNPLARAGLNAIPNLPDLCNGAIPTWANSWIDSTLGGTQDTTTRGFFAHADVHATPSVTFNFGLRYTYEKKEADIATFNPGVFLIEAAPGVRVPFGASRCDFGARTCNFNYSDEHSWDNWTPKVGVQYSASEAVNLYAFWTKGFRSGGYNFRHTDPDVQPVPFGEEEQNSYEVGAKIEWLEGRLRTNLALFHNKVDDMQREISRQHATAGTVQNIRNTADATLKGVEIEVWARLLENLVLTANLGYTDGEYDAVREDLNGDGKADGKDADLDLPRLAELTYSVGLAHSLPLEAWRGTLLARVDFSHNDEAAADDANIARLSEVDTLEASLTYASFDGRLRLSLYGKNLLDEVREGGVSTFPAIFPGGPAAPPGYTGSGAVFAPLVNEGRRGGVRISYRF